MLIYRISTLIFFLCLIAYTQTQVITTPTVSTTTTTISTTTTTVSTTTTTVSTTATNSVSSTTISTTPSTTITTTTLKSVSTTPHSLLRNTNQDFGVCNCDLTSNVCDVNCCCDQVCTSFDLIAFNNCTSATGQISTKNYKWCVPANELFIQNTPYILNAFGDLLCVDINNSLSMNYYQAPLTDGLVLKESYVNDLVKAYYPTVIQTTILTIDFNQNAAYFTNNDYIWVVTYNSYLGFLTLPIQVGTKCVDGPPLSYLVGRNSSCTFDSTAVVNECTNSVRTSLSLQFFIQNFKIIPSPSKFKACGGVSYACSSLLDVNLRFCKTGKNQPVLCSSSSSLLTPQVVNGQCQNLVKKITYIMQYKNPDGFTKALVDVEFFDSYDLSSTINSYFTQAFEIRYVPSTASLDNYVFENKVSGNPGYLVSQPLVAGYYDGTTINVNQDRYSRFTVLQASTTGQCSTDDSNRISIKFGVNLLTECKFQISLSSLSDSACKGLQSQIDNIILGSSISNRPNAFAPFATSPTSDYTQIINSNPDITTIYNSGSNMCKSVRTSASIQIAYALVGNTNNPQAEIQYISYDWSETSNINLRCSSQTCTNKNQIKLSTRVTFVDVSQPPLYTQSQVKRPRPTLPGDFFYPFGASYASKLACSNFLIIFISFVCFTLFFSTN